EAAPSDIDLVITDLTMPQLSGLQLASEIKKRSPGTRIVLITGFSYRVDDRTLKRHGISHLVRKPMVRADMAAVIREALDCPPVQAE
ncbi:MAG: response regulator, partial [Pseudomonadota bacterium]|nr:response regulator [Pseudomonadota bacterium]